MQNNNNLKRRDFSNSLFGLLFSLGSVNVSNAQSSDLSKVLEIIKQNQSKKATNKNLIGISNLDAQNGLKEALLNGAIAAILKTGANDGYWGDNLIRIALPKPFGNLQKNLKLIGASKPFDDLQLKINRSAEGAVKGTRDIFAQTIKALTIEDGIKILKGGDQAGTMLLMEKTKPSLTELIRPKMTNAIDETGAGLALTKISNKYNKQLGNLGDLGQIAKTNNIETSSKDLRGQFIDYTVAKSLDGLFYYIGQEEAAIRKNPAKRTSDLLKKVFGAL